MKTIVNGWELPGGLIEMIASGGWLRLHLTANLNSIPASERDELRFLDVSSMEGNTLELAKLLSEGEGHLFALGDRSQIDHGLLDVSYAIVIAASRGGDGLALDYSVGAIPRVVSTVDGPGGVRWVEVARDFETFMNMICPK